MTIWIESAAAARSKLGICNRSDRVLVYAIFWRTMLPKVSIISFCNLGMWYLALPCRSCSFLLHWWDCDELADEEWLKSFQHCYLYDFPDVHVEQYPVLL